jgi:hypothetical protein
MGVGTLERPYPVLRGLYIFPAISTASSREVSFNIFCFMLESCISHCTIHTRSTLGAFP